MKRTRIVLADDHALLMDAIKNLLEPEFEVVGTFPDGQELLNAAPALEPDAIILDVGMPTMNGLTACKGLRRLLPKAKIIFCTMNLDIETASEAFCSGAHGYVLKTSALTELTSAIREVMRGGYFATPSLTEGMIGSFVQGFKKMKPAKDPTARQKQIAKLMIEGLSMKQVARVLNISVRTVAYHKYAMMERLNVGSSAELVSYVTNKSWAS